MTPQGATCAITEIIEVINRVSAETSRERLKEIKNIINFYTDGNPFK